MKNIFNRRKTNRSTDLKLCIKIFTSHISLDILFFSPTQKNNTAQKCFFRLLGNDFSAYKIEPLSTMRIEQHEG